MAARKWATVRKAAVAAGLIDPARMQRHRARLDRRVDDMSKRSWAADGVTPDNQHGARHRAKKDTRRWCGGRPGREHQPEIRSRAKRYGLAVDCGWAAHNPAQWECWEERYCGVCGKVLEPSLSSGDCTKRPVVNSQWS